MKEIVFGFHALQVLLKSEPQRVQTVFYLQGRSDQRVQKVLQLAQKNHISTNSLDILNELMSILRET